MKDLRSIIIASILAVTLVFPMATWADEDDHDDDENGPSPIATNFETSHQEGVQWVFIPALNHNQCREIPSRFGSISPTGPDFGDRVTQITTKVWATGNRRIDVFSAVTGTAADSQGGTYVFVYENHAIYNVPGDGPVKVRVRMFDRFRLIGNGFSMEVGFDWRWKFLVASGSSFDPGPEFTGVVFPNDPVNPTNVFDFKALSTQGEPFNCDPL